MKLIINGQPREFHSPLTGAELLDELKIKPVAIVVELNREIIKREDFLCFELQDGDTLELVTLVGGG